MNSGSSWYVQSFLSTGTILREEDYWFIPQKKNDSLFIMCGSCGTTNVIQLKKAGAILSLVCQQCGHPLSLQDEIE